MKTLALAALLAIGCVPPIESKPVDLSDAQRACVRSCYALEHCSGDRPDPCADFCLEPDGPERMTAQLSQCEATE